MSASFQEENILYTMSCVITTMIRLICVHSFLVYLGRKHHLTSMHVQAYHRRMFGPKYVWITPSWYSKGWWKEDYGNASCTQNFIVKMLNNSLAVTPNGYFTSDDKSTATFSGMVG